MGMKATFRHFLAVVFLALLSHCGLAQKAAMVKLAELQKMIGEPEGRVKVINFWATWCAPCVKELPYFEKVNQENKKVAVTLVSMDYDLDPNPDKVNRFVQRKKIQSKVVILAESDPNSWIEKIDKEWTGAIPATLLVDAKGKRKFIQGELTEEELIRLITEMTN
jgi:thiol-disulfide isomerase/thioredoxin